MATNVKQFPVKYKNDPTDDYLTEEFNSNDLDECFDYFKETKDTEPLEKAITDNNTMIEKATADIQYLIDVARASGKLDFYANKLIAIRNNINRKN